MSYVHLSKPLTINLCLYLNSLLNRYISAAFDNRFYRSVSNHYEPYRNKKATATRRSAKQPSSGQIERPHDGDFHTSVCELERVASNYVPRLFGHIIQVEQVAII